VVGRREELNLLTDWVTANKSVPRDVRLFTVVAIGGMGKSALTWKWFNDIAPNELPDLAGRMWWTFYESDAYFENFVIRALAYTDGLPEAEVRQIPAPEREDRLWQVLDQRPFLLVLDGLERILLAYARMDAAHLTDDDLDEQTANNIAHFYGLPDNVKETYLAKHRMRQCTDPRAGRFLRRLAQVRASRVLISTRLYPAELQTDTALPRPGCQPLFLGGLNDDDALALWRAFVGGVRSGTSEQLLPVVRAFDNSPLLLRVLAGEVANYRPAPGDFDRWRKDHPNFNPADLPLKNASTHVLEFAQRGLSTPQRHVLHTIAAFRMPAQWEPLRAVLVGKEGEKPCRDDRALDAILTELEDRDLVGWDREANRYDLHPLVRGVVWGMLSDKKRHDVYEALRIYFEAMPPTDAKDVTRLDELTSDIELYNIQVGLENYDQAYSLFKERLEGTLLYRLSMNRLRADLLEMLFHNGLEQLPSLKTTNDLVSILNALAVAYNAAGQPGQAVYLYRHATSLHKQSGNRKDQSIGLCSWSNALRLTGKLREAEAIARQALLINREERDHLQEAFTLRFVGLATAMQPSGGESQLALLRSLRLYSKPLNRQAQGVVHAILAKRALWQNDPDTALKLADQAWELADHEKRKGDFIRAARVQGEATLWRDDFARAEGCLSYTLTNAREVNLMEEELPALTALAELHRRQRLYDTAREYLDQIWGPAERGPYPLLHADAFNVLAQLEHDQGRREAAVAAATAAYKQAWCDGPPYAYHFGLTNARRHLQKLGAPEPQMPTFDAAKYAPMPEVEIDPQDEFH
jgi:tetratricopeptide (TPR) repeat protein